MFSKSTCPACGFRQMDKVVTASGHPKRLKLVLEEGVEGDEQVVMCHVMVCPKCGNIWTYEDRD